MSSAGEAVGRDRNSIEASTQIDSQLMLSIGPNTSRPLHSLDLPLEIRQKVLLDALSPKYVFYHIGAWANSSSKARVTAKSLAMTNKQVRVEMADPLQQRIRELRDWTQTVSYKKEKPPSLHVALQDMRCFMFLEFVAREGMLYQQK